ncbi:MAG: hypothetical protein ACRC20_02950 [Segniliparus sp.]|uniref:hypothetical protein n=1 Tax=Segniliparus sp. TaxID=2804064 RepID=UPI003F36E3D0
MSGGQGTDDIRLEPEVAKAKLAETGDIAAYVKKRGVEGLARCDDPPAGLSDPASLALARRQLAVHPVLKEAFEKEADRLTDHADEMITSVQKYANEDAESAEDVERIARRLGDNP